MKLLSSAAMLFVVLAFAACAPAPEEVVVEEPDTTEADIAAILDLEQGIFDAQNAGDLEAWMNFIDDDPVWMVPNAPVLTSKEAIREWGAPYFEQYDLHEETTDREIKVAGDWGYIRAQWIWTLTPKGGGDTETDTGKSIWILRRQADGSWKVARAIWNSDSPPPAQ